VEWRRSGEEDGMITIGVDAHKRIHAATVLDERGQALGHRQEPNSAAGWAALLGWAAGLSAGQPRQWGIEGAGGYGRGLAQALLAAGEVAYDINPRWTAASRRHSRKAGKSDRLDALAVARYLREEAAALPPLAPDDETTVLDLLAKERAAAVAEATRLRNQVHALLLQLDPAYWAQLPDLRTARALAALLAYQPPRAGAVAQVRAEGVRRLAARLQLATEQAAALQRQIEARAQAGFSPLTELAGVGTLTAGMLAGALGALGPGAGEARLAMYAGVAPLEASSAGQVRHRLNRAGNRSLNAVIHRIALTQARCHPPARAYLARRQHEGKTRREAVRALKRYVVRAVWRLWQRCLAHRAAPPALSPAA
jgi:transposase